jgi:hypothetical protein
MAKAKRTSNRDAGKLIAAKAPFQGSNLRGGSAELGLGRLPQADADTFKSHNPDYVVSSYSTPIAWHSQEHGWHMPTTKYSSTTSRHQSLVRRSVHFNDGIESARK